MLTPEQQKIVEQNRALVEACQQQYNLPPNPNIDEELLLYENFPKSVSKQLAVLILAYKQEVTSTDLSKISTQPAGLIKILRKAGFIFKQAGKKFEYVNTNKERVRQIIDFDKKISKDETMYVASFKEGINNVYLERIEIKSFFCIQDIRLNNLGKHKEIYFLGENGDGKTLLLQGILYALKNAHIEYVASMNVPYIGTIKQLVRDAWLVTVLETEPPFFSSNTYIKNLFAYGVHRSRKSTKEPDEYGFGTLFRDDVYLRSPEDWLLDTERLNLKGITSIKLETAIEMLEELLDHNVKIKIGRNVEFWERGFKIAFSQLSEGYKSVITWVVDMLSRLAENQPEVKRMQDFQGIVLVDEISLHLHPKWEREIVKKLRGWFPNIQFIFTTHSPVNVMGASEDAIFFRLYKDEEGHTQVSEPFYASDMSHLMANSIVTSPLFGLDSARMRTYDESTDLDTSASYLHSLIRKEVSKQVQDMRDAGKKFINPATLDNIIKNVLDKYKKS